MKRKSTTKETKGNIVAIRSLSIEELRAVKGGTNLPRPFKDVP